ncbi:hypothetical protein V8C44DRAFT_353760 [Trichoderma aethiopicum]
MLSHRSFFPFPSFLAASIRPCPEMLHPELRPMGLIPTPVHGQSVTVANLLQRICMCQVPVPAPAGVPVKVGEKLRLKRGHFMQHPDLDSSSGKKMCWFLHTTRKYIQCLLVCRLHNKI